MFRELRVKEWLETLLRDTRCGFRVLRKNSTFTLIVILSLSLGIGSNVTIFSMLDAIVWRPLPVYKPAELVSIGTVDSKTGKSWGIPPALLPDIQEHNHVFSGIIVDIPDGVSFRFGDATERVIGDVVTANYFSVLGVKPHLGRFFAKGSDGSAWEPVAVLSYDFFERRFVGDPSVIGKTIYLNGYPFTIIGVSPPDFFGVRVGSSWEVRMPMMIPPGMQKRLMPAMELLDPRNERVVYPLARLEPGVGREQAETATEVLTQELCQVDLEISANERCHSLHIRLSDASHGESPLKDQFAGPLAILMAFVGLVLLMACTNVANLLLARATARQKETAVRLTLGATRARIFQQFLIENLLLVLVSCLIGTELAAWGANLLVGFLPQGSVPIVLHLKLNLRVLSFAVAISLMVAVFLGLASSLLVRQKALVPALRASARWFGSGEGQRVGAAGTFAVVSQIAISLVLLVVAGLFLRTLRSLKTTDPGLTANDLIMFSMKPVQDGNVLYTPERLANLFSQLLEKVRAVPGIADASMTFVGPFSNFPVHAHAVTTDLQTTAMVSYASDIVTPGYFEMLGVPVIRGRDFSRSDHPSAPPVAIITNALAHDLFGNTDPIGHKVLVSPATPRLQVIGVIRDLRYNDLRDASGRALFRPFAQVAPPVVPTLVVRARVSDLSSLVAAVRHEIHGVDDTLPVFNVRTAAGQMDEILARERMLTFLSSIYGALALLLTLLGFSGAMAYAVSRRTNEIGIRMALGAQREDVARLVLSKGIKLTLIGFAIGVVVALALTRFLSTLLYNVRPTDPMTFGAVSLLLVSVSLLACYLPARRAMRVDPMVALHYE